MLPSSVGTTLLKEVSYAANDHPNLFIIALFWKNEKMMEAVGSPWSETSEYNDHDDAIGLQREWIGELPPAA